MITTTILTIILKHLFSVRMTCGHLKIILPDTEFVTATKTTGLDIYTLSLIVVFVVATLMIRPIINQCYEEYRRLFSSGYEYFTVPVINENGDTQVSLLAKDAEESDDLDDLE